MSDVKLMELAEAPGENQCKRIELVHPLTDYVYPLAVYFLDGRYFVITDTCKECHGSLARGKRVGLFAFCSKEDHPWNVKTGLLKYDRTRSMPVYRVHVRDDGIYIEI